MNNTYNLAVAWQRRFRSSRLFQVLLLLGFWSAGEGIARMGGLPIPGSIIGLFILLILLGSKQLSLNSVQRGAQWFIAEMLLFFIPAVLAVLDHPELLGLLGLKILAVIVLGTLIVMVVTATVIDVCYRASVAGKGTLDGTN